MQKKEQTTIISDYRGALALMNDRLKCLDHEEVWVIFLKNTLTLIGTEMVSMGTLKRTAIDCRTIIKRALLRDAISIILLHNHPSGNPLPSSHDISFTEKLRRACDLMDIGLLDHIIIAEDSFYSFTDNKTGKIK